MRSEHSFNILAEISSGPLAFFGFSSFKSFSIPLAVNMMSLIFGFVGPSILGETLSSVEKTLPNWSLSISASIFCTSICTIPFLSRIGDTPETSVLLCLINVKSFLLFWPDSSS